MKRKILKLSLLVFFIFGFCTVTSMRVEEVLVPKVSVVHADYQDDMFRLANVPTSCLSLDENWGKGIWVVKEEKTIWGVTEYQAIFLSDCIVEEHEDYVVVKDCPKMIVQDSLKPLRNGEKVRLIE